MKVIYTNRNPLSDKGPLAGLYQIYLKPKPYDLGGDLGRTVAGLRSSLDAKPPMTFLVTSPGDATRRVKEWYDKRMAEISGAEQAYGQRLASAYYSGRLSELDYVGALMDLFSPSPMNPFQGLRQEVVEIRIRAV